MFDYSPELKGFEVDIKYAQAVVCEIPNPDMVIPTKVKFESWPLLTSLGAVLIAVLVNF